MPILLAIIPWKDEEVVRTLAPVPEGEVGPHISVGGVPLAKGVPAMAGVRFRWRGRGAERGRRPTHSGLAR